MSDSDNDAGFIETSRSLYKIFATFSDPQNVHLDLGYVFKRVRSFGKQNAFPIVSRLKRSKLDSVIESIESPTFEILWECTWYLRRLVDTGRSRNTKQTIKTDIILDSDDDEECTLIEGIHRRSVKAFTEYLSDYVLDLPSYWSTWCTNILVGYLKKLIPFSLPPLIWKKILSYLTPDADLISYGTVLDNLPIGTLTETKRQQILEKSLLQESILLCSELVRMVGVLLYAPHCDEDIKYLSASISKTAQLFTSSMMRLDSLLKLNEEDIPTTKSLNMMLKNEFCGSITDFIGTFNSRSQDSIFFINSFICANDQFESASQYFVWLEKGSQSDKMYRLIYVKKDVLSSFQRNEMLKTKSEENIVEVYSIERPAVYCSGSIVGVVTSQYTEKGEKRHFIWVWDLEVSKKDDIFKYKLDRLTAVYNKRGMATVGIDSIGKIGLSKIGTQINIVVTINFELQSNRKSVCTFVLAFDLKNYNFYEGNFSPKPKTMCADSTVIGVHKKYVFSMRIGTDCRLVLQDLQKNLKPLTTVEWVEDNPWEVRFNCNPSKDTCLLYRENEIQLRKLDDDLTFIRDITLYFEGCSPLKSPFYQFFDDTLYGWRRYDLQETRAEHKFENVVAKAMMSVHEVSTFFTRVFNEYDEQFVIDLTEENVEPVYFDTLRPLKKFTKVNDPSCVTCKAVFSGFNTQGDLQQMMFTSFNNDCSNDDFGESGCYSACQTVNLATVKFYNSCKEFVEDSVPDIEVVLEEQSKALSRIAKEKEEEMKKKLELEQQRAEAEARRKELIAKIAEKKALLREYHTNYKPSISSGFRDVFGRRERLMKHINNQTRFDCIIARWTPFERWGFGDIIVDDQVESVFIHNKSFTEGKNVYKTLVKGSLVQFRIEWDHGKPRPKAVETRI